MVMADDAGEVAEELASETRVSEGSDTPSEPHGAAGFAESQDGGYFSNFGNAGFIWSHGCASDVHTSICGLNQLGSSKLAVLIATNWGTESGLTTIGEPQSGQKPRRVLPPISLGEACKRSEPCKSLKASVGTMTKDENGPPLDCWQSRQ